MNTECFTMCFLDLCTQGVYFHQSIATSLYESNLATDNNFILLREYSFLQGYFNRKLILNYLHMQYHVTRGFVDMDWMIRVLICW